MLEVVAKAVIVELELILIHVGVDNFVSIRVAEVSLVEILEATAAPALMHLVAQM
jgi:hypothetical protein